MSKKFKKLISLILSFIMIISCFNTVFAFELPQELGKKVETKELKDVNLNERISIIVELEAKALLDYSQPQSLGANSFLQTEAAKIVREEIVSEQKNVQKKMISTIDSEIEFKYSYTNTINAFSTKVLRKDISKIKDIPGVKNIYFDSTYELPTPQMSTSNDMINVPSVWNTGYKGEGTVIAVIDTGVDINHEIMLLSDSTNPKLDINDLKTITSKLNSASLVDDLLAEEVYKNSKFPYCFDYADSDVDASADMDNHGVHVAGIIAANSDAAIEKDMQLHTNILFNGVSLEAQILGMKVFSSIYGGALTTDIIAAVEDSISLGADVLNLSLGSISGFTFLEGEELEFFEFEYSFKKAREAGIIVSVAAGNDNRVGLGSVISNELGLDHSTTANIDSGFLGSPASKKHATAVASIENTSIIVNYIQGPDGLKIFDFTDSWNYNYPFRAPFLETLDGIYEYIDCGLGRIVNDDAEENINDFDSLDLTGKIALIKRGDISFAEKADNAISLGAIGVIIYDNIDGELLYLDLTGVDETVPVIYMTKKDGEALAEATDKKIEVSKLLEESISNEFSNQMSNFTSWGPTPDLNLKPEITAPGGQIYSTLANNEYGMNSGTSMAAPHVAGASAIMQQYMKSDEKFIGMSNEEKSSVIEALLMSTARPAIDTETNNVYSPRRQGAGLMDLEAAINSGAYLINESTKKAKIELFDKIGDRFDIEFDIVNLSNETYEYELSGSIFTENFMEVPEVASNFYITLSDAYHLSDAKMTVEQQTTTAGAIQINSMGINTTSDASVTGSAIVSVGPREVKHVKISVELDSEEISFLEEIFVNGFFVEGFISLISKAEHPSLSIPYLGFYDDWTKAPAMDGLAYYEDSLFEFYYPDSRAVSIEHFFDEDGNLSYTNYDSLGSVNNISGLDYIGFSPNGDGQWDRMSLAINLLRNVKKMSVKIYDSNNKFVANLMDEPFFAHFDVYSNGEYMSKTHVNRELTTYYLPIWDGRNDIGKMMPDGKYNYVIKTWLDYNGEFTEQTKTVPFRLDTVGPRIVSVENDELNKKLRIEIEDDYLIAALSMYKFSLAEYMKAIFSDEKAEEITFKVDSSEFVTGGFIFEPTKKIIIEYDYKYFNYKEITLSFMDIAGNIYEQNIEVDKDGLNEYKIRCDVNGGGLWSYLGYTTDVAIFYAIENTTLDPVNAPTKYGYDSTGEFEYDFAGWFETDENGIMADEPFDFNTPITRDYSLIAKWENPSDPKPEKHNVTFKLDGGNISGREDDIKILVEKDTIIADNKPVNPVKSGYDFIGWFEVDKDGKLADRPFDFNTAISSDLILTAKWNKISIPVDPDPAPGPSPVPTPTPTPVPTPGPNPVLTEFMDIDNHWAKSDIEYISSLGLVNGTSEKIFSPDAEMSRGQLVTILARLAEINKNEYSGVSSFNDVDASQYYAPFIEWASQLGIVKGIGNGQFSPEAPITREQLAHILMNYAEAMNLELNTSEENNIYFTDEDNISSWAKNSVNLAKNFGIIKGNPDGNFEPQKTITRAEVITMLARFIRNIEN